MAYFKASLSEMLAETNEISVISARLRSKISELDGLATKTKVYSARARRSISNASEDLSSCTAKMDDMAETLQTITGLYRNAEAKCVSPTWSAIDMLTDYDSDVVDLSSEDVVTAILELQKRKYVFSPIMLGKLGSIIMSCIEQGEGGDGYTKDKKQFLGYDIDFGKAKGHKIKFGASDKNRSNREEFGKTWDDQKYTYDEKTKKFIKEKSDKSSKPEKKVSKKDIAESITIAEFSYSFLDDDEKGTVIGETENGSKITLNKRDLYIKHKLTAGSFESKIGAAYSMLTFETGDSRICGNDMLGVHGSAKVELMSASASAGLSVGWLDENGNFDPNIKAGVNMEAVIAKASGEAGVDILGCDVNVKGSVGVGLGFHANAKIDKGVLDVNFGGYLGFGGDVSLEIDLSGAIETVDKVVDFASDAVGVIGDVVGDGLKGVGEGIQAAGEVISNVGEVIGEGAQRLGNAISEGWKKLKFW